MESLPERFRHEFPIRDAVIFLDHAAVSPLPARTAAAVAQTAAEQRDHAWQPYKDWEARTRTARENLARLMGASPSELAFVKSTTAGLIIAAEGIPWREGDNVVLPAIEFPANVYPWLNLARRGVQARLVEAPQGRVTVDDLAAAMDAHTRAVAVSWVQYSSGCRVDLAALSELCHERGAYLVVDAIQGLGAIPLDVHALGLDFASADGHKWLLSVEGCGVLYVSPRAMTDMNPVNVGWMSVRRPHDFEHYNLTLRDDAARFEEGSLNTIGTHALGASAALLLEAGPQQIWQQICALTDQLAQGLLRIGCEVVSPLDPHSRSGILSFTHPRVSPRHVVRALVKAGIIASERRRAVRLSPHFYNDHSQIEAVLDLLAGL